MAAPIIENSTDIAVVNELSFNVNLPSGTIAGDLLVAIIAKDDDEAMASSHGFTEAFSIQYVAGVNSTWCWYKIAVAADITRGYVTFTGDREGYVGRMYRITGFDSGTPIDVVDTTGATGNSATPQAPEVETVTDDALVFAVTGMDDNDEPYALTTGGWTTDHNTSVSTAGIVIGYKVMSSAGLTGVADFTTDAIDGWAASMVAIRPSVGQSFYETPSDSLSISEALANKPTLSISDSQSIAESLATVSAFKLALPDSIPISEAITKRSVTTELADTQSITESLATKPTVNLSDSMPISESVANKSTLGLSDSLGITEGLTFQWDAELGLSDSLAISESLAKDVAIPLSDSISFVESLVPLLTAQVNLEDSQSISESITKIAVELGLPDSLGITESPATTSEFYLELSDSITFIDSEVEITEKALADSQSFAESLEKAIVLILGDSLSIADSEVEAVELGLSDSLLISESLATKPTKLLVDTLSIAEQVANQTGLKISDSQSISEATEKAITLTLSDSISFADSEIVGIEIGLSDSQGISEDLIKDIGVGRSDTLSISESLANLITLAISDSISFAEEVDPQIVGEGADHEKDLSDSLAIGETLAKSVVLNLSESLVISESLANLTSISLSDAIGITEQILTKRIQLGLSDSISFADSSLEVWDVEKGLSDSLLISEALTKDFVLVLSDSVSMADSELELVSLVLSDSISFSEEINSAYFIRRADDTAFIRSNIY